MSNCAPQSHADENKCYHCHEPIPANLHLTTNINGQAQPMCCLGCQAISQTIVDSGLTSYYQYRSEPGTKGAELVPSQLQHFNAYDLEEVQQDFVHKDQQRSATSLTIEGITCAACAWLIEHKLKSIDGIHSIMVNSTTERAMVSWNNEQISLSEILTAVSKIGYQAAPYQVDEQEKIAKSNSRKFLLRLGLAGFATMQVMMFALALYSGYFTDLEQEYRDYFRWVSMIFAAPVVFYSAQPFYFSAIRSLLGGKLNMDFSVSLAIAGAYIASIVATVQGDGEVYFESVSMFTFFLLLGRYFEQAAKQKASVSSSNLHKLVPLTANLVTDEGSKQIAAKQLKLGDIISVKPGEMIAADGLITKGLSAIDESMLTGEHLPVNKVIGDKAYAGTINSEQPIELKVTAIGQDQLVAEIIRLQEVASNTKPKVALLAEQAASYFSAVIIAIAAITYIAWQFVSPEDAFWVTLSVLVATCPCALALATPTAITCATTLFTKLGIITRKSGVFEKLPKIDQVVFDKTGTLTRGQLTIDSIELLTDEFDKQQVCELIAALESSSYHPIAQAFKPFPAMQDVTDIVHHTGAGISATFNNQATSADNNSNKVKFGSASFVNANNNSHTLGNANSSTVAHQKQQVYLSINDQLVAVFTLSDAIREDSKHTIADLNKLNIASSIASGDQSGHVNYVADTLGIAEVQSGLSPQGKLDYVQQLQVNKQVAMFGDGINDAPVLAGANLSVAMGSGTALAQNSADLILLGDKLSRFSQAIDIAKKTHRIIRQNLIWALGYNVLIIPLAVTGHVLPYIAAIGMSLSSIIVVSNSLRLLRTKL
ncbi:heavy metal translocating P-type ATPase [Shewanella sp. WXL01]|uniref:heavy metal translocating P-type ATPase n=1 Tax=Shewanella sp. WXL01 TaxID=2709721 RepID=UPI002477EAEC|nr:heavy metal translocating P-type ATPase [Shewanella sp. WXL01]